MGRKLNVRKAFSSAGLFLSFILIFGMICWSSSCRKAYIPRPYGYFRVYLPEHEYRMVDTLNLPYRFEMAKIAHVEPRTEEGERYWIDVKYPMLNASIHCSYKPVYGNLLELSEDVRRFVYTHVSRADGIAEDRIDFPEYKVYSILYGLRGNVASPVQFVITDSVHHFFRGALYFENVPNKDSIAPMVEYVHRDIIHLIETFEWMR